MNSLPKKPLHLAVIGAGHHSRAYHLPALAHYNRLHPATIALVSVVDRDLAAALAAAADFGFATAYTDVDEMLAREKPDACLALTPVALNAGIALHVARLGLPLLMEKPIGATITEARHLVEELAARKTSVMVSMNRRFDPLLRAALEWIGPRPIHEVRATMARRARTEPQFVEHTGLHVVDVVRAIGGEVVSCDARRLGKGRGDWFQASLVFANGAAGLVDLMPTAGVDAETLRIAGDNFRVEIRSAEFDRGGWRAWSDRRLQKDEALPRSTPMFIANGTFAETEAFVDALAASRRFHPAPAEVLPSMELCRLMAHVEKPMKILKS